MKNMLHKIFSILLAACFILSAVPAPAAAAETDSPTINGSYVDGAWKEGGTGSVTHEIDGTKVTLSKKAAPVEGQENTFDVTLKVETSTTTSVETTSGAVVLVIDTSGSMAYCSECGTDFIHDIRCPYFLSSFWGDDVTRLDAAQDAAYTFLQTYAGTDANASRMLAIVSFASGSEVKLNWANVAGGKGQNSFDAAVNAIYDLPANGGTYLEAGLKSAEDLMGQSTVAGIASKSVIALTDGAPTKSHSDGNGSYGSDAINTDTANQAASLRAKATLYTIGFGVSNQRTHSGGLYVNDFLRDNVASSGKAYTAENRDDLFAAFSAITKDITSGLSGEGWTATDPMADMISVTSGTGENFSGSEGTYTWKLSNAETVTEGNTTTYVYTYTYTVKLDVQGQDFEEGKYFPTNERTYLTVNGKEYDFPVPGVKGVLPRTDISVNKKWEDNNNQDGKRTESVTVQLVEGNREIGEPVVLSAENNWTHTWDGETYNLIEMSKGVAHEYQVVETEVPDGYTSTPGTADNGFTVTNTHVPEKISISGTKTWDDNNNQDGKRPESITINLLAGGAQVGSQTVTEADGWAWSFTDLDKYAGGKEIVYTITEDAVEGYTPEVEGYNVTNTHVPELIDVSGAKTWADDNNRDGKRPESITVYLMNGETEVTSQVVTPDEKGNWTYTFENVPKYQAGQVINYTVKEAEVADYEPAYNGMNIENSHTPELTDVEFTKIWDDNSDQDGKRPESIKVQLMNGETVVQEATVTGAGDTWGYTFTDLYKYEDGKEIVYTVREVDVDEFYTASSEGLTITNTHTPEKTSVTVTKEWKDAENQDGKRPQSITVKLLAGGKETGKELTLTATENWTGTFSNLDKYADAKEIEYSVVEELPKANAEFYAQTGYKVTESENGYNITITNKHEIEKTSIAVNKVWDDAEDQDRKRPESVTITLLKNNESTDQTLVLNKDNEWSDTFENLDKYENGSLIAYTIAEEITNGYTPNIEGDVATGFTVTNTYAPEKTSVTVKKVWVDDDNRDNIQPADVTIKLLAGGKETDKTLVLSKGNDWNGSFTDLDKFSDGVEIEYTIEEVAVKGYDVEITGDAKEGFTVTNTHKPEKVTISGTKTWDDGNNQDHTRPEAITVKLMANGTEVQSAEVKPNANGKWTWTFTAPKYNKGVEIPYTVEEVVPEGYNATYPEGTYDIENFYSPETINIKVTKAWIDGDNQDGLRPEEIVVKLTADLTDFEATLKLNEDNKWTASFEELDKNFDGKEITYTLEEVTTVEGYDEPVIEGDHKTGFTVKNIHEPEVTEVIGKKTWNDANNQDGKRPESITVKLLANGQVVDTQVVSEKESWIYTFENLPKFEAGEEIIYTVVENEVPGYSATYSKDNYNITNSYTPETINIKVSKSWVDNNDADGIRPTKVTIYLYANGEKTGDKLVLTKDEKWTGSFTDLPKYEDGKEIKYTIAEKDVKGYNAVIKGSAGNGFTVTNSHNSIPKTGDERTPILWIAMMLLAIIVVFFASRPFFYKKGKYSR